MKPCIYMYMYTIRIALFQVPYSARTCDPRVKGHT